MCGANACSTMIYLASPYSDVEPTIRDWRFRAAITATVSPHACGPCGDVPVVYGHQFTQLGVSADWSFWQRIDRELLARCDEVIVLTLDGWSESKGVQAEIEIAKELGKPTSYLDPAQIDTPETPTLAAVSTEVGT